MGGGGRAAWVLGWAYLLAPDKAASWHLQAPLGQRSVWVDKAPRALAGGQPQSGGLLHMGLEGRAIGGQPAARLLFFVWGNQGN